MHCTNSFPISRDEHLLQAILIKDLARPQVLHLAIQTPGLAGVLLEAGFAVGAPVGQHQEVGLDVALGVQGVGDAAG